MRTVRTELAAIGRELVAIAEGREPMSVTRLGDLMTRLARLYSSVYSARLR